MVIGFYIKHETMNNKIKLNYLIYFLIRNNTGSFTIMLDEVEEFHISKMVVDIISIIFIS